METLTWEEQQRRNAAAFGFKEEPKPAPVAPEVECGDCGGPLPHHAPGCAVEAAQETVKAARRPRSVMRYEWEREMWNCPDVPASHKGVLAALSFFAEFDSGRGARPGEALLAETSCVSRSTVSRVLKRARRDGWVFRAFTGSGIAKDENGNRLADEYWLTVPDHDHGHDLDDVRKRIS
ncbi:hypothetical protein ACFQ6V_14310 [Streptomyces roseifaciens]